MNENEMPHGSTSHMGTTNEVLEKADVINAVGPDAANINKAQTAADELVVKRFNDNLIKNTSSGYPLWKEWADKFAGLYRPHPGAYPIPSLVRGERRSDVEGLQLVATGVPCFVVPDPPFVPTKMVNGGFVYVSKPDGMYRAPLVAMSMFGGGVYDEAALVKL